MKILFISPRYEGGIGGHAFRVAEKLRDNGFDVKLMHAPYIPIKNIKNPSFAFFGTLKSLFDKEKYDAVHAWNVPSAFIMKNIKLIIILDIYQKVIFTNTIHENLSTKLSFMASNHHYIQTQSNFQNELKTKFCALELLVELNLAQN